MFVKTHFGRYCLNDLHRATVAARESKAVRRSLIDKLEQQSKPQSANEIIVAIALANVAQERRLKSIENKVVRASEEIKQGTIPAGFQGYKLS
ncbi:MAG: hypothetical protein ACL7BU_15450 [Candidatus Phlomobacter fragariae]